LQTHQIQVSGGAEKVDQIRAELFGFPEVLEVFSTGRPDSVVVVCSGRPRPTRWLDALMAAGYQVKQRRHATGIASAEPVEDSGARPVLPPPRPQVQPALRRRGTAQVLLRPRMP
jgi:hypothetical protein